MNVGSETQEPWQQILPDAERTAYLGTELVKLVKLMQAAAWPVNLLATPCSYWAPPIKRR